MTHVMEVNDSEQAVHASDQVGIRTLEHKPQ